MSGENSKKSGEIGEKIASELLKRIGWQNQVCNISIDCNDSNHKNSSGNPKDSHGDDIVYIYDNPFHDETTTISHISVKHTSNGYPKSETAIRTSFNKHIKELEQIIECARYNGEINSLIKSFEAKTNLNHIGILIWLHNDRNRINQNILPIVSNCRLNLDGNTTYYIIDSGRANFLLKIVNDLTQKSKANGGQYQFYYPKIGTSILVEANRKGNFLPVELIASDIITAIITTGDKNEFYLYSRESFDELSYKNMVAYALNFSAGLVKDIHIGFPDYNPTNDADIAKKVKLNFRDRDENIIPFSYNESILDLF